MDSFNPVTPQGGSIVGLFLLALAISALVLLLVVSLLVYALLRFRARPGEGEPPQVEGHRRLEIAWTAAPTLLLAGLFILTVGTMNAVDTGGDDPQALRVQVVGFQWWWEYRYADGRVLVPNELHVPVGVPVRLELVGGDVIHSFWVPQFGWKRDAVPGKTNVLPVRVDRAGVYDGACTEFCGLQHAWMRVRVVAEPRDRFDAWLQQQQQPAAAPRTDTATRGQQLFLQHTCVNCHTVRGTPASGQVGPDLTHFGSRATLASGVAENTPENLRRWIQNAQAMKPGVLMPPYNTLPDADVAALAEYLAGLQ